MSSELHRLIERIDDLQACRLEMTPVVRGDRMTVKKGGGRNQGILARHRPIFTLEIDLNGNLWRAGGRIGFGHRANCASKPTAPRRLGDWGVRMRLFLPSRMGRTSTTPALQQAGSVAPPFGQRALAHFGHGHRIQIFHVLRIP